MKMKKMMCVLLTVVMLFSMGVPAFGADTARSAVSAVETEEPAKKTASATNSPFSIEISTDKSSYSVFGTANVTVTVTNTSGEAIENVSAEALFDGLTPVGRSSKTTAEISKLSNRESLSFSYSAMISKDYKELNIFQKIILFFIRLFKKSVAVTDNGFNDGRDFAEESKTISFGKFDTTNTVRVYYPNNSLSNNEKVTFSYLSKKPYEVTVGTPETITFYADVESNIKIQNNEVDLYIDNRFAGKLNDNGKNGDESANDGTFSGRVELYSNERKEVSFYVKYKEFESEHEKLDYYMPSSSEEQERIDTIMSELNEIRDKYSMTYEYTENNEELAIKRIEQCYSEMENYLKNCTDIKSYSFDDGTMTFLIDYNGLLFLSGSLFNLISAQNTGRNLETKKVNLTNSFYASSKQVTTLQPYYTFFNTSVFDNVAKDVANKCDGYSLENGLKNQAVTIENMKGLTGFKVILLSSHGGNWAYKNSRVYAFCLSTPSTTEGDTKYSASNDLGLTIMKSADNNYALNEKFFDKYYDKDDLKNSIIYLGTCHGGDDDVGIRSILDKKGAQAVFSWKNSVTSTYDEEMVKTIFEQMSSGKTAEESYVFAKRKHGDKDPYIDEKTRDDLNLGFWVRVGLDLRLINGSNIDGHNPAELRLTGNNINTTLSSIPFTSTKRVKGQVFDKVTNKPISNVKIKYNGANKSYYTDENGIFSADIPVSQSIMDFSFSHDEYMETQWEKGAYGGGVEVFLMPKETEDDGDSNGGIIGYVKEDGTDLPLKNITVAATNGEKTFTAATGDNGAFSLELPVGSWEISPVTSNEYYCDSSTTVEIEKNKTIVIQTPFYMKKGNVSGVVKDEKTKNSLGGVKVTVWKGGISGIHAEIETAATATTNANGEFAVTLPEGTYAFRFTRDGYAQKDEIVTVDNGWTIGLGDIYLTPKDSDDDDDDDEEERDIREHGPIALEGKCGENIVFKLHIDGALIIRGNGQMYNYSREEDVPWFSVKDDITDIIIHAALTTIPYYLCSNCHNLTSVIIPNSVTGIGYAAFSNCTRLVTVNIPSSVTYIGSSAFSKCSSLTSLCIPNKITSIEHHTFSGCTSLTSIEIPNSVTSIHNEAFEDCASLTNITIPNSVTEIWTAAFSGCKSLKSVNIPNSVTYIGGAAFYDCKSLTSVSIPNSVSSIEHDTFDGCTSLSSITIPSSITSIEEEAFSGCISLTTVNIPNNVSCIGSKAFANCTNLTKVTIQNGVTVISGGAFFCTGISSITIPSSVSCIGGSAFQGCTNLINVDIQNGVTEIGGNAFAFCYNLTNVSIPSSVTSIGGSAFQGCTNLTNVTIPNSVTTVGITAFEDCSSLQSVTVLNNETKFYRLCFKGCSWKLVIYGYVGSTAQEYAEANNIDFSAIG